MKATAITLLLEVAFFGFVIWLNKRLMLNGRGRVGRCCWCSRIVWPWQRVVVNFLSRFAEHERCWWQRMENMRQSDQMLASFGIPQSPLSMLAIGCRDESQTREDALGREISTRRGCDGGDAVDRR